MKQKVLRISEIATTKGRPGRLPVSPSTVWRWVREGHFPKPFKLSDRVTVWYAEQVEAFLAQQVTTETKTEVQL